MQNKVFKRLTKILPGAQKNVLMKNYTTYKIGGPAKYFFVAKSKEDLILAVEKAKELKVPIFILGGGSNLLVSDKGFSGLVIKISNFKFQISNSDQVYAEAGLSVNRLVDICTENSLSGIEWAAGIPGITVGGAVYGNAQAFGTKIADLVKEIEALDLKTMKFLKLSNRQCRFSLKNSIFKKNKNLIIVSAALELKKAGKKEIEEKINKYLEYRKKSHPINFPSAGSVFVNPVRNQLPKATGDWLTNLISNGVNPEKIEVIPVGFLVEKLGLRRKQIGKARISEKHGNFIINTGGAKSADVVKLIKLVKQKVKKEFGINLEVEVQFVGIEPV